MPRLPGGEVERYILNERIDSLAHWRRVLTGDYSKDSKEFAIESLREMGLRGDYQAKELIELYKAKKLKPAPRAREPGDDDETLPDQSLFGRFEDPAE